MTYNMIASFFVILLATISSGRIEFVGSKILLRDFYVDWTLNEVLDIKIQTIALFQGKSFEVRK